MVRISTKQIHWRLFLIFILVSLAAVLFLSRLFSLQILRHREYLAAAARQNGSQDLMPRRGAIYFQDKNGNRETAALNEYTYTLSATPEAVADPNMAATELASIPSLDTHNLIVKLSAKKDPYIVLGRKLDDVTAEKIRQLNISGVFLDRASRRTYPYGAVAAQVLGLVKFDRDTETGQYGVERMFEQQLRGNVGILEGVSSTATPVLALGRRIIHPATSGKSLVLTIDYNVQARIEEKIDALMKQWSAERGLIIVMDPTTGKILGLSARPGFDPNDPGKATSISNFMNQAVESTFELGSVMKPITMAAGIDVGVITPDTKYTDTGEVRIKGYKIQNFDKQAHGAQTMTQVLEKSLNTGAVFVEGQVGDQTFLDYLKRFGFGERTGIDLPGEVKGNISNLKAGRKIEFATASFGQGIAVTPMQMATAIAAVANGGNLMRPYVVDRVIDDAGVEEVTNSQVKRRVISQATADTLTKMLISVTKNGFDNHAAVAGYFVAGKTGTAEIPNSNARGYSEDVIHSFVGYAPAFRPKFLVFIQLNRPQGVHFASSSLTPIFHDIAAYLLDYYGATPDNR